MNSKTTATPPGTEPKRAFRRKLSRFIIHMFVWIGIAVGYYVIFSLFFDTPNEYRVKSSTAQLEAEYEALVQRYDSIEMALDNVAERDKNVFHILFEADPYDLESEYSANKLAAYEKMLSKSTSELNREFNDKMKRLNKKMNELSGTYTTLQGKLAAKGDAANYIPSIQPVVNNGLTLMTASFGLRIQPFYKTLALHAGVDYTVPEGSRVFATADGWVKEIALKRSSVGSYIIISHDNGYETQYNHLSKVSVKKGDFVRRGDIIALSGNTGLSLVPHLHYEVKHNGMRVDPIHYFFMELSPSDYRKLKSIAKSGMQSFD